MYRDYVVTGLGAIVLSAEMNTPRLPESKNIPLHPTISWEDDTEENRQNKELMWWSDHTYRNRKKWRFRSHTPEEKEILIAAEKFKLEHMFDYILKNYGWENAEDFYNWDQWRRRFDRCGYTPDFNYPHCRHTAQGQCDLFCPFYQGKCNYQWEDIENENNL